MKTEPKENGVDSSADEQNSSEKSGEKDQENGWALMGFIF
jgi:hypothetical protein